jgi:hypothetical protein
MSLFRSPIRPPAILSDEAVGRYVAAIRAGLDPDPLFRRRLRGQAVNRFVEAREGHAAGRPLKREMTRIGRAVLYASFVLSLSVTGAFAASQQAIPGEILYPLKRQIEEIRVQVLPTPLHGTLAVHELSQRIVELHRLAENGKWALVVQQAAEIERAYEEVLAIPGGRGLSRADLMVINGLLERLPGGTRTVVEDLMVGLPGIDPGGGSGPGSGTPDGAHNDGTSPNGAVNRGGTNDDGSPRNATEPDGSPGGSGGGPSNTDGTNPTDTSNHGRNQEDSSAGGNAVPSASDDGSRTPMPTKSPKPTTEPAPDVEADSD